MRKFLITNINSCRWSKILFNLVFTGFILIQHCSCGGGSATHKSRSQDVESRVLINGLIQLELKKDSVIVSKKPINLPYEACYKASILTNENLKLLFQNDHEVDSDTSGWVKNSFRFSKIISQAFVVDLTSDMNNWVKFNKSGNQGFYNISKPLFSKNYTHALVRFEFICGSRCGSGTTALFKKVKGKWQIIERFCITDN